MDQFKSVDDVLQFAIGEEIQAYNFYMDMAERMDSAAMKKVFVEFAGEELGHRRKLESIRQKGGFGPGGGSEQVPDLKLADIMADVQVTPDISYQDALVVAMKKEKAAFGLYTMLADFVADDALRQTFAALAQEDAKHKLRFEMEYDDLVNQEN